jgi:hypothetical protein
MNENVQGNKGIKRKIKQQQGKKQKYKKGNQQYREKKKERKKHTMRITTVRRKPIMCRSKTDAKGGIRSSSWWGREKRLRSRRWAEERTWRRLVTHTKQSGRGEFK